jgi:hypothetical protein
MILSAAYAEKSELEIKARCDIDPERNGPRAIGKSALPSRTDFIRRACQVRKVP